MIDSSSIRTTKDSCIYVNKGENVHDFSNIKKRMNKNYDKARALEESKKLLALISSPTTSCRNDTDGSNLVLSSCFSCKLLIPLSTTNQCKLCNESFCGRHRSEVNHNCEKLSKDTAKYLNAKNLFKLRLRDAKNKAVR